MTDKRPSSSRPGEGVVTFEHVGRNQYGVVVARATRVMLVRLRPAETHDLRRGLVVLPGRPA